MARLAGTGGVGPAWEPGINEAIHASSAAALPHAAPADGCACGLYALARFDNSTHWWARADVLGAVEAWADVDEGSNLDRFFIHETGFRAQYAKVILLATSDNYPRAKNGAIRALAAEYGADTCRLDHLEDAAKEHGQLVPDDVLAWAGAPDPSQQGSLTSPFDEMAKAMTALTGVFTPDRPHDASRSPAPSAAAGGATAGRIAGAR